MASAIRTIGKKFRNRRCIDHSTPFEPYQLITRTNQCRDWTAERCPSLHGLYTLEPRLFRSVKSSRLRKWDEGFELSYRASFETVHARLLHPGAELAIVTQIARNLNNRC
jgi:hypothetical protein